LPCEHQKHGYLVSSQAQETFGASDEAVQDLWDRLSPSQLDGMHGQNATQKKSGCCQHILLRNMPFHTQNFTVCIMKDKTRLVDNGVVAAADPPQAECMLLTHCSSNQTSQDSAC
jgi:hypothetical protein